MTKILKGKELSDEIKSDVLTRIEKLKEKNITPTIATVRMGKNADDISYERNIIRTSDKMGIKHVGIELSNDISTEELTDVIKKLNKDVSIHGILILSLLTNRDDQDIIRKIIDPEKDIDGVHPLNLEKIFRGEINGFGPCAPIAAIRILEHYNIPIKGKNVVIINRSMVVGKPLAMMALAHDATITICHSHTEDLTKYTRNADIVCLATGKAKAFGEEYFNPNSIVIDLGIAVDESGKLCGDANFDELNGLVNMITPVPGGVGGVTTSILLEHVVISSER